MQFQVAHQLVGRVGKEALQATEEGVGLAGTYLLNKLLYLERSLYLVEAGIIRYEELDEPLFHLPVWEAEAIKPELLVVVLYRKISALEDDWQRFFVTVDAVQHIGVSFGMRHVLQVVVVALQQFHQVGGRACLEPIAAEFIVFKGAEQAEGIVNADGISVK